MRKGKSLFRRPRLLHLLKFLPLAFLFLLLGSDIRGKLHQMRSLFESQLYSIILILFPLHLPLEMQPFTFDFEKGHLRRVSHLCVGTRTVFIVCFF